MKKILTGIVLITVVGLLIVKTFFVSYYRIPQNGMYPSFPAGSTIFAVKHAYSAASDVQRGDIVVFVLQEQGRQYNYIWRVVGLPGEKVEASGRTLSINGREVDREPSREENDRDVVREILDKTAFEIAFSHSPTHVPPVVSVEIPLDHFFVMGDNRFEARDSRYFGPIPFSSIIGRKL